jgi:glucose/arabinose dehydrogenase
VAAHGGRVLAAVVVGSLSLTSAACSGQEPEATANSPTAGTSGVTPSSPGPLDASSEHTTGAAPTSSSPSSATAVSPAAVTVTALPAGLSPERSSVVASHFDVPWGIAFLPDGSAIVTERDTRRLMHISSSGRVTSFGQVPGITPTSEGGLLGVAVSPTYARDSTIFVYCTTASDNRVLAGTVRELVHGHGEPLLTGIPRGDIHNGGRLAFGPDGKLYVTTGETGRGYLAQNLDSLGGKILRINADGSIPADNPFPASPVWSYGHRNVQGIAWDGQGRLWATEFGSQTWDEINLIQPGNNYGWPAAEGTGHLDGMTDPYAVFSTSAASPSGLAYAAGALWLGALQGQTTWRVPVTASGLGTPQAVRLVQARTRTVVAAPDGTLWVTTSNTDGRALPGPGDDRILAIRPR